jgi:putative hydroxymethylpyrimidine transport system substrate-binding protein
MLNNILPRTITLAMLTALALLLAACGESQTATPSPTQGSGANETPTPTLTLTEVRVALDWFPWSNHSGLYIAKENGYFAEEGLDVEIYVPSDPATILQTVGAGQDDFGISYQPEVLLAGQQGIPVMSIAAIVQHPLNSVMAVQSSGIERPRDLAGKKIGAPGVPTDEPLLATMLEEDGISLDDVEIVNVGYDLVPALISGRVDAIVGAYWVHESISAENQGYPVNIMRMEEWGVPDFYELVLVANSETTTATDDLNQRFVRAVTRGYEAAIADPQGAIDILKSAAPEIDEDIERPGVELLAPLWVEGELPFGVQREEKWENFASWMVQEGLLTNPGDVSRLWTNQYVNTAN